MFEKVHEEFDAIVLRPTNAPSFLTQRGACSMDAAIWVLNDEGAFPAVEHTTFLTRGEEKGFGEALSWMELGYRVARKGWNGSGMFAFLQKGYPDGIPINKNTAEASGIEEGTVCKIRPYFMLFTAQGDFAHWVPSGSDILARDWVVLK